MMCGVSARKAVRLVKAVSLLITDLSVVDTIVMDVVIILIHAFKHSIIVGDFGP